MLGHRSRSANSCHSRLMRAQRIDGQAGAVTLTAQALVAQWIEHAPPKRGMQVRFLPGALPVMRAAPVALPRGDRPSRVVTARHATKNILQRGSDTGCQLDRVLASAPRRLRDRVDACLSL